MRVLRKQFDNGVDHFQRTEHAQFDRSDFGIVEHGIGLSQYPLTVEDAEVSDVDGVLHGQGGDGRSRMATLREQSFDICLQAGATTWVVAGETEDNGARAVDIHGARAYHQTSFLHGPSRVGRSWFFRLPDKLTEATALDQWIALKRPF